jgi:hypothetical protein
MADPERDRRRITLPTLNGKPSFMNAESAGINATSFGQRTNASPFAQSGPRPAQISSGNKSVMGPGYGPLPGGYIQAPQFLRGQTGPITAGGFGHSVPWNPMTDPSLFARAGTGGPGGGYGRLGGDARIGSPFARAGVGGTAGGGGYGAPGMSPLEMQFRDRYDKAIGPGAWDNFVKTRGMSPIDFYRDPRNKYWDEPDTPDGAFSSAIRDEMNNARNYAQWVQEHGTVAPGQEQYDRWYYANRQGMRVDDVMNDGSEVVY